MKAKLVNKQGCVFDNAEFKSQKAAKEWAKGRRGGAYKLVLTDGEKEILVKEYK